MSTLSLGKLAASSDETSGGKIVLTVVGLIATVLVTVVITRSARKALNERTDVDLDSE